MNTALAYFGGGLLIFGFVLGLLSEVTSRKEARATTRTLLAIAIITMLFGAILLLILLAGFLEVELQPSKFSTIMRTAGFS